MKRIIDDKDKDEKNIDNKSSFRYLCLSKELAVGGSRQFSISNEKGREIGIAVFNIDGQYYAISNTCQHQGGPIVKVYWILKTKL
jgi:nitrite reductase/ring-hydroxylating ferredoxin subunit